MKTVEAIYENGVFRPRSPVDLPDRTVVQFEPRAVDEPQHPAQGGRSDPQRRIYQILSERYDGGEPDAAERHDEHQP